MSFLKLIGVELKKIRRSHIFWILLIPVILLWIPTLINYDFIMNPATDGLPRSTTSSSRALWGWRGLCSRRRWSSVRCSSFRRSAATAGC